MKRPTKQHAENEPIQGAASDALESGASETRASETQASETQARRRLLYGLLGDLPERQADIACSVISVEERPHYFLERLLLDLNGFEPVPAYFVRPLTQGTSHPTILYSHAHGGNYVLGKDELLDGRPELHPRPYAVDLAARGYAVLAMDHWNFGERRGRTESELFKELLWKGHVLFGLMVYDNLKALDYLLSRSDVDPARVGALGMSMGSTLSWWTAALDERIAAVAEICCLTDFHSLMERRGLDGHGVYYYVPGLLKHFTTSGIQALICPRPHLSLAGEFDLLTPPEGLDRIDREMKKLYTIAGAPEAWKLSRYKVGHVETVRMRSEVLDFFHRHLDGAP